MHIVAETVDHFNIQTQSRQKRIETVQIEEIQMRENVFFEQMILIGNVDEEQSPRAQLFKDQANQRARLDHMLQNLGNDNAVEQIVYFFQFIRYFQRDCRKADRPGFLERFRKNPIPFNAGILFQADNCAFCGSHSEKSMARPKIKDL